MCTFKFSEDSCSCQELNNSILINVYLSGLRADQMKKKSLKIERSQRRRLQTFAAAATSFCQPVD